MWWYFCGALSYPAICRIHAQTLAGRLGHPVTPHGQEGEVDVLAMPEFPCRPGDRRQDRRQLRIRHPMMPRYTKVTSGVVVPGGVVVTRSTVATRGAGVSAGAV